MTVGVQQADRDRLCLELRQRLELERRQLSVRAHAPAHAERPPERDERLGLGRAQPVEMRTRLPAQVQHVLEAGVRHERRSRALPFEQCVRRDRRPVGEALDRCRAGRAGGRDDRALLPCLRQHLRGRDATVVDEHGVRERPADVDAEDRHSGRIVHPYQRVPPRPRTVTSTALAAIAVSARLDLAEARELTILAAVLRPPTGRPSATRAAGQDPPFRPVFRVSGRFHGRGASGTLSLRRR